MAEFNRDYIETFLGIVRKYMQVRGSLNQKDLANLTEVGVSTMSRFLNQKTSELSPQLIARIVAKLNIPLHEIIDFVEEDFSNKFIRLVKFYKDEIPDGPKNDTKTFDETYNELSKDIHSGTADKTVKAQISTGSGKKGTIHFTAENDSNVKTLKDKLESLTPRQKAYMTDFLNLDMEGKDLLVDVGNSLLRYIRQKGMEL